jgi:hypothetical protein
MQGSYYTNFLINQKTGKVIMAIDYDHRHESLAAAMQDHVDGEISVERCGPLSYGPLFETPGEWEPEAVRNRIAY